MKVILVAAILVVCVSLCLNGLMKIDKNHGMVFSAGVIRRLCLGSLIAAQMWYLASSGKSGTVHWAWFLVHVYFISCSLTDYLTCQVYDVFQYLGIAASAYLALTASANAIVGFSILLFALLQYFLFMKMYGKADGMAFLVAAMAEASLGYDINMYLLHMISAYLLLCLVQGLMGNIGGKGRLKVPVPFLPYITAGFWGIIVWGEKISVYM